MDIGTGRLAAVASYLVNSLAPLVESLDALQKLSPFYYYSAHEPLRNGLAAGDVAALVAIAAAAAVAALLVFARRDLAA